ncbi:ATP-dependent DNA helicase RecG [Brevinema andersonii]|uniref:ATP-dependent DNA helicase RecG n=1 Tax=Brevinema andersonii TaxID=34097 RepID=UPI0013565CCA|nr:ATP-dependent DNA helicase RecG [Brevinema andersonii]
MKTQTQTHISEYFTARQSYLLSRIGIQYLEDLLEYYPVRYEDRSTISTIADLLLKQIPGTIKATVERHETFFWNNKSQTKVIIKDQSSQAVLVGFNHYGLAKSMPVGNEFYIFGRFEFRYNTIQTSNFEFESVDTAEEQRLTGKILPIYKLTEGLRQKELHKLIRKAFSILRDNIAEPIPHFFIKKRKLYTKFEALHQLHFPEDFPAIEKARQYGAYEEFLFLRTALGLQKSANQNSPKPRQYNSQSILNQLFSNLPFRLTDAQNRVIKEIADDLNSPAPMNRLLQGDVGSGKTTVALASMLIAAENNHQSAFLVPTEVLAFQHYKKIQQITQQLGFECMLLTGSTSAKERVSVLEKLKNGELKLIVGTHALFQEDVYYAGLGLAVIDEQHKFGVEQRRALIDKGSGVDVLLMSATPIPRTMSLALHGDLGISVIDELPKDRQQIKTIIVNASDYKKVFELLKQEIYAGRQAFVVCPLIEESESLNKVQSAEETAAYFSETLKQYKIGLVHGRMSQEEKDAVMKDFAEKKIDILTATTVIEVGIDIPNATIMIIENAERFGLAQLHQLRGRVGRSQHQSYCIAINRSNEESNERLEIFENTLDGFAIAEADLQLRGAGEILGTRQTGDPIFKLADLSRDSKILSAAVQDAALILEKDPALEHPHHAYMKKTIL